MGGKERKERRCSSTRKPLRTASEKGRSVCKRDRWEEGRRVGATIL